ncbi:MAG: hypothetical protein J6B23_00380 [Clostridia bacterium]|nr:hypothetical protein [Clostridia bacterium]
MRKYLISNEGKFYKANLHSHSSISDGCFSPEELKRRYMNQGYSVLAYTDHNIMLDMQHLTDENFVALNGYEWNVVNCEPYGGYVNTPRIQTCHIVLIAKEPDNLKQVGWHRTKYLYGNAPQYSDIAQYYEDEPDFERIYTPECINEFVLKAKKAGFYVIQAHPTWSREQYPECSKYEHFDAVEIYNNSSYVGGNPEFNDRTYDDYLFDGKKLACVATDDNHNWWQPEEDNPKWDSYGGFTMIKSPKLEYREITKAIEKGDFYCSTGPEIYELYVEDGKVHIECSDVKRIAYISDSAPAKAVNRKDGETLTSADFEIREADTWFRLKIVLTNDKVAYTNAYFVNSDLST